jgi:hypothetical protein
VGSIECDVQLVISPAQKQLCTCSYSHSGQTQVEHTHTTLIQNPTGPSPPHHVLMRSFVTHVKPESNLAELVALCAMQQRHSSLCFRLMPYMVTQRSDICNAYHASSNMQNESAGA